MTLSPASSRRTRLSIVCALALLAAACGGGDDGATSTSTTTLTSETTTTTTTADDTNTSDTGTSATDTSATGNTDETGAAGDALTDDACAALLAADALDDTAVELVSPEFQPALRALGEATDAVQGSDFAAVDAILAANPDMSTDIDRLVEVELSGCSIELTGGLVMLNTAFAMFEPADDQYCAALVASDAEADTSDGDQDFAALGALAVPSHRDALERIADTQLDEEIESGDADPSAIVQLAGDLVGFGMYSEGRCGIADAFGEAIFGGAFLLIAATEDGFDFGTDDSGDDSGSGDGASDDGTGEALDPTVSREPLAADLVEFYVNATGGSITEFDDVTVDLDTDDAGEYLARLVIPRDWSIDGSFFGVSFEPPEDSDTGFFTDLVVSASCQGFCSPTDEWPDRFAELLVDQTIIDSAPLADPEGRSVVIEGGFGNEVRLGRWNPAADHFFECKGTVDSDGTDLLELFLLICTTAEPSWIE